MAFVLECPYPGATSCVVIGPLAPADAGRLRSYPHVLWLEAAPLTPPSAPVAAGVERVALADITRLGAIVDTFVARQPRRLPTLLVSAGASGAPVLQQAVAEVHALLEGHHRARFTRQQDGFRWQRHVLANLPAYLRHRLPDTWQGAGSGRPAFICGAGPSLDVTAPLLAARAGAGLVLAADSAVRALERHGVHPDFVVSIDAAKVPEKCLDPQRPTPARVVLSTLSPPAWWQTAAPGNCVFLSGRQVTEDWLERLGAAKTAARVTENCGSTALELARFLGCAPIYLFGLDLALDESQGLRRHHEAVEASVYSDSNFRAAQRHPRVPGNCAATVPTHVLGDWRALDQRLQGWPAGLVINVTDRGARLQNTTVCPPDAFRAIRLPVAGSPAVERLALPVPGTDEHILSAVRRAGQRAVGLAAAAKDRLATGGPTAAAGVLRTAMLDPEIPRLLGAYALRLMPHLVPPLEGDGRLWQDLVAEFDELARLAAA